MINYRLEFLPHHSFKLVIFSLKFSPSVLLTLSTLLLFFKYSERIIQRTVSARNDSAFIDRANTNDSRLL